MFYSVLKIYAGLVEKKRLTSFKKKRIVGGVAHTFNPNTWKKESGRHL